MEIHYKIKLFLAILPKVAIATIMVFVTTHACIWVSENYFFDKFYYKKSADYGYFVLDDYEEYNERSKELNALRYEKPIKKTDSNYFNIGIFGDSYVYGTGIKNKQRFYHLLEKELNKIRKTKVTAFSESSTSPINFLEWHDLLVSAGNKYDLIIIALVDNDAFIRPKPDLTPLDHKNIVSDCQKSFPSVTPIFDISLKLFYNGINDDERDANKISEIAYEESWKNPVNQCVLRKSLMALPTENTIYFITADYNNYSDKFAIYQKTLLENSKFVLSSSIGKNLPKYQKYWRQDPFQSFAVSRMEQHPNKVANQMYADILLNEITTNPRWKFKQ